MDQNGNIGIVVYWEPTNSKEDELLANLSITSGAYGEYYLDDELFDKSLENFFSSTKKDDRYIPQLVYLLKKATPRNALNIDYYLKEKWDLTVEYINVYNSQLIKN